MSASQKHKSSFSWWTGCHIRATRTRTKLLSYMTVWLSVSELYRAVVQLLVYPTFPGSDGSQGRFTLDSAGISPSHFPARTDLGPCPQTDNMLWKHDGRRTRWLGRSYDPGHFEITYMHFHLPWTYIMEIEVNIYPSGVIRLSVGKKAGESARAKRGIWWTEWLIEVLATTNIGL